MTNDARHWLLQAQALIGQGKVQEAEEAFRRACEIMPDKPELWCSLGKLQAQQNHLSHAEEAFAKACALKPDDPELWCYLGTARSAQSKGVEAEEAFRRVCELRPQEVASWGNLAAELGRQGRYIEAEQASHEACEVAPENASAWNNLGVARLRQGKFPAAEDALRKACELEPSNANLWATLGGAQAAQGKNDQAERAFRQACKLEPGNTSLWDQLGIACFHQQKYAEVEVTARKICELQPDDGFAWNNLGMAQARQQKLPEAETSMAKACELQPEKAEIWNTLGEVRALQGKLAEAEEAFRKACELDADDPRIRANLLQTQKKLGEARPPQPTQPTAPPPAQETAANPEPDPSRELFPIQVVMEPVLSLIPGKLNARVYTHERESANGPVPCWSYTSEGLKECGQRELTLTLLRAAQEEDGKYPQQPFEFFKEMYDRAQQGHRVDEGDITELGQRDLFGFKGLAYLPPEPFLCFEDLSNSLSAVLITEEEIEAVKAFGIARLISRLGSAYRYYPCPPWSDRSRASLPMFQTMRTSILSRIHRIKARGVSVRLAGSLIVLRLGRNRRQALLQQLEEAPPNAPLALLTELDPGANSCLCWEPGQTEARGFQRSNGEAMRLTGCFMAFLPTQTEDGGKVLEDGFVLSLTDGSWTRLKRALANGEDFSVHSTSDCQSFSLNWI